MNKLNPRTIKPQFDNEGKVNLPTGTYLKAIRNIDNQGYKDNFVFLFSKVYSLLRQIRTVTAYRTYFALSLHVIEQGTYEIEITQKVLAEHVGCAGAEISKAINELGAIGLILTHSRGLIVVDPKYIWRGSLAAWQDAVSLSEETYKHILNKEL